MIRKCELDDCRFKGCDEWIKKHVDSAKKILEEIGIDSKRLKLVYEKEER